METTNIILKDELITVAVPTEVIDVAVQDAVIVANITDDNQVAVQIVEEIFSVDPFVTLAPPAMPVVNNGVIPFIAVTAAAGATEAIIDCNQALAWKIDVSLLRLWPTLKISVINWPANALCTLHLLIENVDVGGCAIIWPIAAGVAGVPVGPGISNHYELRTWNGGQNIQVQRTGYYRID